MKLFFTKKNFMQKIIICIVLVLLVNFTLTPTYSQAALHDDLGNMFFNVLLRVGDAAVWIVQRVVYGLENSFIKIDRSTNWKNVVGGVLLGIAAIAGVVASTVLTGGAAAVAWVIAGAGALGGAISLASASRDEMLEVSAGGVPANLYLPVIIISPEYIFSNKLGLTDVNFFNPSSSSKGMYKDPETGKEREVYYSDLDGNGKVSTDEITTISTAAALRDTITKWYYAIRNLALVGLLSVLVYVGIRIIISSSTTEKAKYKAMITDWLVAICLVMVLHYIMVFAITLVEKITVAVSSSNESEVIWYNIGDEDTIEAVKDQAPELLEGSKTGNLEWPVNLLGSARMESQFLSVYDETKATTSEDSDNIDLDQTLRQKMSYTIIYLAMIFFTIFFLFYYLKRVIYLAFLTLIAPLIALTYPIDKINDGTAQGFSVWLKEYMYNLLIQPFHILLYTVFITTAFDFAETNPIYVCVVLGFLMPAEKLLRKMFNFNKSETASAFSGAAAGSMVASAVSKLAGKAKTLGAGSSNKEKSKIGGKDSDGNNDDGLYKGRTNSTDGFLEGGDDDSGDDNGSDEWGDLNDEQKAERDRLLDEKQRLENEDNRLYNDSIENPELDEERDKAWAKNEEERKVNQKAIDEFKKQLEADREKNKPKEPTKTKDKKKLSDQYKQGRVKSFAKAALKTGWKRLKNPAIYENGVKKALRFSAAATLGGVGASVVGISSLAAGESPKEILAKAALGGSAGYALGSASYNLSERVLGGTIQAGHNFGSDLYSNYKSERLGPDNANRDTDVESKIKSEKMERYLDKNYAEASKKERKENAQEIAEYSADTGVNDYKMIDKARDLHKSGALSEAEAKSLLVGASKYKAEKPTGGMMSDADKAELRKAMLRKFTEAYTKKEKEAGNDVKDSKIQQKINKNAQNATKKYVDNFEKLL
ncbi:MAG: hypothetical protein E7310_03340 [Clostridiales bacterium]|nr:hypothetical protein [Clostridiales bacterium]